MLAKILVTILMVRYFNNDESIRKSVTFFKMTFKLDGRSGNNPITQALTGNKAGFAGVQQDNPVNWWNFVSIMLVYYFSIFLAIFC